jgi:hypothetical protein
MLAPCASQRPYRLVLHGSYLEAFGKDLNGLIRRGVASGRTESACIPA